MKYLNGSDLSGYIKERQFREVSKLLKHGIKPRLAIIVTINDPVIEVYLRLKKKYGTDIGIEVKLFRLDINSVKNKIKELNKDKNYQGIIVQLPIAKPDQTDEIVNLVSPDKDVDGLGRKSKFNPATPLAIQWLLSGYNVDLIGKEIVIVGKGRLVGGPLEKSLKTMNITPTVINKSTKDIKSELIKADVIITATGVPKLITEDMLKQGAVIIDAGVASENGKTVGDLDPKIYEKRDDLTITPQKGGVGPLTICALFENLILASNKK